MHNNGFTSQSIPKKMNPYGITKLPTYSRSKPTSRGPQGEGGATLCMVVENSSKDISGQEKVRLSWSHPPTPFPPKERIWAGFEIGAPVRMLEKVKACMRSTRLAWSQKRTKDRNSKMKETWFIEDPIVMTAPCANGPERKGILLNLYEEGK